MIYSEEFKDRTAKQVIEDGHLVQEVAGRLSISRKSIYAWIRERGGNSRTNRNELAIDGLKEEISGLMAELKRTKKERDILKSRGILCECMQARYAFIMNY